MELTLFMIVKNESKIIQRCLESVKDIVNTIVISDTGSTDDTVKLIHNFLKTHSIKGTVYTDEWKNFGYNRSKSYKNAQEWLRKNNYDLKKQYLLTIDADMIFKVEKTFDKNMLSRKDSWLIQQKNPHVVYYNKRLFRSDLDYTCIGVTHEYWGSSNGQSEELLQTMFIDDLGDGGAKADKFTRDIRLLTQGLIDEPKNERYYFYLAQSYADSGDSEKAIEFYKKRIEAGGWNEEVFMAYLRLGDIYSGMKNNSEAIHWWSLGYEHLPSRAETLWRIIHTYRIMGKNLLALSFYETAIKIPYPSKQLLFIEKPVYDYKLLEEFSIFGFYTEKKHEAFIVCDFLRLQKDTTSNVLDLCNSNLFFYLEKLSGEFKTVPLKFEDPYICSSSSFFKSEKGFVGNVRAVNYSMNKQFQYSIRGDNVQTKNYWVEIENDLIVNQYELLISPECKQKRESHIKGVEDFRLCKIDRSGQNEYVGLGVSFEYSEYNHPSVCLCTLSNTGDTYYISKILPTNFKESECQKNWCPFYSNGKLLAVYSHHPLTILQIDIDTANTTVHLEKYSQYNLSSFRGSSSPIQLPNGNWIMVIHELLHKDTRKYFHRFVIYDSQWNLAKISIPFYFKELFVEFTLSLVYSDGDLFVFFSKEDNTTEIVKVPYKSIKYLPVKDYYKVASK